MRGIFKLLGCVLLAAQVSVSCTKVSSLSDSSQIESVTITGQKPAKVELGTPVIDKNTVEIPVIYGKYLFPITVSMNIKANCTQLLGFEDDGNSLVFDNMNHIRELYTVAASGATTVWKVKLVDASSNESAEIIKFAVTNYSAPEGALVAPLAAVNSFEDTVRISMVGAAGYPITVTPDVTIAEDAKFLDAMPQQLTFESAEDKKTFRVEAVSGRVKTWTIMTLAVKEKDNSTRSKLTDDQYNRLMVDADRVTMTSGGAVLDSCVVNFNKSSLGEIRLILESGTFPFDATIAIPSHVQSTLFGVPTDNKFRFSTPADKHKVYMLDRVSGLVKVWTIAVSQPMNTDIKSFTITSSESALEGLIIDKQNVTIDPLTSRIIVPVDNGQGTAIGVGSVAENKINVKLGFTVELYDGSTTDKTSSSHTYITNTEEIVVEAGDGLLSRNWYVCLKDKNAAVSSNTKILNMFVIECFSKDNRMVLYTTSVAADNKTNTITLRVKSGSDAFPLRIAKKSFRFDDIGTTIVESDVAEYDKQLVFESLTSEKQFTVKAADGTTAQWKIMLQNDEPTKGTTAEIVSVSMERLSNGALPKEVVVNKTLREVQCYVEGVMPMHIIPQIITTDNATVSGLDNNTLVFDSYTESHNVTVTSEDGKTSTTWKFSLAKPVKVQIGNSDFELWGKFNNVNGGTETIDPTPGLGYGWSSANLLMFGMGVTGTKSVTRADGTFAAELTTNEQFTLIKGYVMAAGTLYTGVFRFDFEHITAPRKMTKFGIPFTARPTSVSLDVKYTPGTQLKEAVVDDKGSYAIRNIDGIDKGQVWVELLQWSGEGAIDYDGNPSTNIKVIGRAELIIDGANNQYPQWGRATLPIVYDPENGALEPTHIVAVMSSSKDGDKFIGATGSKLNVDKFVINY